MEKIVEQVDANFGEEDFLPFPSLPVHKYFFSNEDLVSLFRDDIFQNIIYSRSFNRLKTISFLGAIDYVFHPNQYLSWRRHSRFDHTIGVGLLAQSYARLVGLPEKEKKTLVLAALLHDIGHSPLSHTLEKIFNKSFGINHHIATKNIIIGNSIWGNEIRDILTGSEISIEDILMYISGETKGDFGFLFNSPINMDTIEAISRCLTYINANHTNPAPARIMSALVEDPGANTKTFDDFWRNKAGVYRYLIQGEVGALSDFVCREFMVRNLDLFSEIDFYLTERHFRKRHNGLFKRLSEVRSAVYSQRKVAFRPMVNAFPSFRQRRFLINFDKEVSSVEDLKERYSEYSELVQLTSIDLLDIFSTKEGSTKN